MTIKELACRVISGKLDFGLSDDKNSWRSYSPFLVLVPGQPNISLFVLGAALMFFWREIV